MNLSEFFSNNTKSNGTRQLSNLDKITLKWISEDVNKELKQFYDASQKELGGYDISSFEASNQSNIANIKNLQQQGARLKSQLSALGAYSDTKQAENSLSGVLTNLQKIGSGYFQAEQLRKSIKDTNGGADDYYYALNANTFEEEYNGYSYDQLQQEKTKLSQGESTSDTKARIRWIENNMFDYATSAEIEQEWNNAKKQNAQQIKQLTQKRDELQEQIRHFGPRPIGQAAVKYGELLRESNSINEQIEKLGVGDIAYTTGDGQNITWQTLYDTKKYEEDFNALYEKYSSNADWAEKSKFTSQAKPKDSRVNLEDYGAEQFLEYIHGDDAFRNELTTARYGEASVPFRPKISMAEHDFGEQGYDSFNEKEKELITYLYNTDKSAYNDALNLMKNTLLERHNNKEIEDAYELAQEHPVAGSLGSIALKLASSAEYMVNASEYIFTGNSRRNVSAEQASAMRQGVSDLVDWNIGDWDAFDFIYGTGMSAADSAVSSLMFGKLGGVVQGLSAAAQSTNDALNRGMSKGQAFFSGLASGVFEGIFESWSLGSFTDLTKNLKHIDVKNLTKYIGKNMWNNAKEETLTEIANIIYDMGINGEFSQAETSIRQLMSQGMSESEAKKQVALQLGAQIAEAAGSGALMGFGFGGAGAVFTSSKYSQIGKSISTTDFDSLLSFANNSGDAALVDLAKSISDKSTVSNRAKGELAANVQQSIASKIGASKTAQELVGTYNNLTLNQSGYIISLANRAFAVKAAALNLDENTIVNTLKNVDGTEISNAELNSQSGNAANNNIDTALQNEYNSTRGEGYVRTDEFRNLQAESQGMSDEDIQLYHSGSRKIDESVRANIARIFQSQINSNRNGLRNNNELLGLESKGNKFNIYSNVNGSLFHDVFQIARNYLRNGELVDLHGIETTEDGIGYNDCYNYLSEDGLSGFSITPDGDLISVFNASGKAGFLGAIAPIVKEKAKTLDCYNSPNQPLKGMYEKIFGFKTASVMDYNMEFDHDNIAENHGSPQIAFMVNTDADVETKSFNKDQYDEAVAYRNSFVSNIGNIIDNVNDINRSEQNVGEGQVYNGSERLGREGTNTQSGTGAVQEADGGVYGDSESDRLSGQYSQGVRNSNNRRIEPTPEQKESLKTTVVKNEDGTPKAVYHFTENMNFETFGKGDIGFHFGNISQAQRHGKGKNGRTIVAHLAIKNPIRYRSDLMFWSPRNIAFMLQIEGVISLEERLYIEDIAKDEIISDNSEIYSSRAAVELRRILSDKGYDGIVYENMFEGEGESYIAFYPEQVIIIDDGLNTSTGADSDGSASFMPENSESGVTELSAENPKYDMIEDIGAQMAGTTRMTDEQRQIFNIGKALGWKVEFGTVATPGGKQANGKVNYATKTITINPKSKKPIQFILKHELTHYLERNFAEYADFANYVMDSKVFKNFVIAQGYGSTTEYNEALVAAYRQAGVENFGEQEANYEIVADFVGECLFGGNSKATQRLLESVQPQHRPTFVERIKAFFASLKSKLSKNAELKKELTKLENLFIKTYRSVEANKNTAENSGEKYSINHFEISDVDIEGNMRELAKMASVYNVKSEKLQKTGKKPSEIFSDFFDSLGNSIYVEQFGDIALSKSSVKSEIRHGITAEKIASIEAIPTVLQQGKIIFAQRKTGSDVDRIVVGAPITIGEKPYYMGVMLQRDTQNQRLYLHNVIIEEEMSNSSQADLLTTGALEDNEHLSMTNILQKALSVKNKYMQDNEDYSIRSAEANKNTAENSGEKYSINHFEISDVDIEGNMRELAKMDAVTELSGQEFSKGEKDLVTQVDEYFSALGYSVENSVLGDVDITTRGAKDSIAHGIGRNKAIAFTAVPNVIKDGKIIDYQKNWKNRGYDTVVLAAPITINNKPFYAGVIVIRDSKTQRFYLHEVITEERTDASFKTGANKNVGDSGDTSSPSIISLLDKVRVVKEKLTTEEVDNTNSTHNNEDYSIPVASYEDLLERYEKGEITREEFLSRIIPQKELNPVQIANLTESDANTTPKLKRRKGESNGNKQSQFYDSLLNTSIFDSTFKEEIKDDSYIKKYMSVTNAETLRKAAREIDDGGQAYVNNWFEKDAEHASLIDVAVGLILMDRYQRVGDYESAVAATQKVRSFGTAGGQQIQIFSILSRLDPNAMAIYAQKELSKAFEIMVKRKSQKWIDKNASRFELSESDIEFIRRRTLQASKLPDGRDKAIRLAEICTLLQDKLPPEKGQSIKAYQRIAMLLNVKTNIRNFVGNLGMIPVFVLSDVFGSGIDRFVSKKTGVRTTGNFDIKSVKGFKKGAFETIDDFRRHIHTRNEEMNRFDIGSRSGKSFNENNTGKLAKQLNDCARVLNALDRFTSFCLELGDRPFYEMWLLNSINNQMKLNKVSEPTPEMIAIASSEALQRTWQDTNKIVEVVAKAKSALNVVSINGYGLGDVMIKFTKTPANLTKAIVDFSPAGLIKSIATDARALKNAIETGQFEAAHQKKFVDSFSKGIAGTLLYVLAIALISSGNLTGAGDEDDDAKNFEKYIQGIPEYSIKLFGKWWSYDWMQPIGSVFASVADYMDSKEKNPDNNFFEDIISAIKAGGEVLYNQSFMQSIQMIFTADNPIDGIIDSLCNDPSVYIPQFISQIANASDEYRRVTYEYKKPFETALNKVKVKIPLLRQTLPKQVDVLGRDVPNSQGNIIDAFFNPANTYTDTSNEVTDKIYSLYKQTGDKKVIPRKAPYSITVKGITRTLTAEETLDYQRIMGAAADEMLEQAFSNSKYTKLTDSQKVKLITKIYDFSAAIAKSEIEYDYDVLSAMEGNRANGTPILTKDFYNKLKDEGKVHIAREYFLSKTELRYVNNTEKLVQYYINQVGE